MASSYGSVNYDSATTYTPLTGSDIYHSGENTSAPSSYASYFYKEGELNTWMIIWIIVVVILLLGLIAVVIVAIVTYDKNKKKKKDTQQKALQNQAAASRRSQGNHPLSAKPSRPRLAAQPPARYQDDDKQLRKNKYLERTTMGGPVPGSGAGKGRLPPTLGRGSAPSTVADIDEEELKELLQPGKPICCIMFYSPRCSHCHTLLPKFHQASAMRANLPFVTVNCDKINPELLKAFDVQYFPKVVRAHPGTGSYVEYKGDRSAEDMLKFAMQSRGVGEMKKYL
jgi:thiol-disulfide isomerase/thioredoxin